MVSEAVLRAQCVRRVIRLLVHEYVQVLEIQILSSRKLLKVKMVKLSQMLLKLLQVQLIVIPIQFLIQVLVLLPESLSLIPSLVMSQ